ncbi:MAG: glycosyltransferase family 4 protein [bacterium]|nr:glycosyltransferase family 4 protein [bacterium]
MHNKILNILEINFSRAWGGLEMQMPITARALGEIGHNVIVVCPEGSQAEKAAKKDNLRIINLENRLKYIDLSAIWKLKKIIKENKIDIVHSHMAKDLWIVIPAGKMAGCKKIYFTRHMESHYRKKDIFHNVLYRSLAGAIAITGAIKESLIDTTHIIPEKIDVIYCGIDVEKFRQKALHKNILRKEYNIAEDYYLIGVVGRLQDGKGHEYMLRAIPAILKNIPKVKIFIVGEETKGEEKGYRNYLENIVRELNISDDVIFTGFRSDVPAVMNSLDILILPSKREAFGLVIIEAMALGKIVIATKSQGTQEIIDDGIDGFLIPYENSEIIAQKVIDVLSDNIGVDSIRKMALQKVEEKFDLNKNIKKLEQLFLR